MISILTFVRSSSEKSLTGGDEVEDAGLGLRAQLVARPTEDGPVIPSGVEAVDELRLRERGMENRADDSRGTNARCTAELEEHFTTRLGIGDCRLRESWCKFAP